jgi:hypothetical protein
MTAIDVIAGRPNPVIFDADDRFLFFPNNKVCQRSIVRVALKDRAIVRKDDESVWRAKLGTIDQDYLNQVFKFTVVRNPFDRAVSAFAYLQGIKKIARRYNFASFCKAVLRDEPECDPHFQAQSDGLFHDGRLLVDYVGRFETIADDWRVIAGRIGHPNLDLPHVGPSKRSDGYRAYYDAQTRQIVADIYADDLASFGYDF